LQVPNLKYINLFLSSLQLASYQLELDLRTALWVLKKNSVLELAKRGLSSLVFARCKKVSITEYSAAGEDRLGNNWLGPIMPF
jgi:hypothetical protein